MSGLTWLLVNLLLCTSSLLLPTTQTRAFTELFLTHDILLLCS
jgi:hypothetical protein